MSQTIIEVRMKDGTVTTFPIENLENFKRLCGQNIAGIKPLNRVLEQEIEPVIESTADKRKRKVNQ